MESKEHRELVLKRSILLVLYGDSEEHNEEPGRSSICIPSERKENY